MRITLFSLLICLTQVSCIPQESHKLQKQLIHENWSFSKAEKNEFLSAQVPGVVHLDLLRHEKIQDPYVDQNETKLLSLEEENWTYRCTFNPDPEIWNKAHKELCFYGIDTYADVFLNDTLILKATNMFRSWTIDVSHILKEKGNELRVVFESPINRHRNDFEKSEYQLPSGCETVDIQVGPYTRKAPYHFGWDWGPRILSAGLWRPVELTGYNDYKILRLSTETESFSETEAVQVHRLFIQSNNKDKNKVKILINNNLKDFVLSSGLNEVEFKEVIKNPQLWWPNGFGNSYLYPIEVSLRKDDKILDECSSHFGIRSVYLHREVDDTGEAFYFEINGEEIFAKGANYIPQDLLLPRTTKTDYRRLLIQAKEANMNMIRVWGGGIYEDEYFYDLCDSLGLMVWQDFMFAGSLYPGDPKFLNEVEHEVIDNVQRLQNHPSIVLWCGNNEVEVAMENWAWEEKYNYTDKQQDEIKANYYTLFDHVIPRAVEKIDSRPYVHTSPLSNWGKPEYFNSGSMHYWGVWHGGDDFNAYRKNVGRFMVEYGFQSFPSYKLLQQYIPEDELDLESESMKHRQKSYIGNGLIQEMAAELFYEPSDFKEFIELSQKTQAEALRIAIQSHRKERDHCMGTLYWQLNDCWPGPSWSTIQYDGNPKMAYYTVKKWYQSEIAFLEQDEEKVWLHIVTDHPSDVKIQLEWSLNSQELYSEEVVLNNYVTSIDVTAHGPKPKELNKLGEDAIFKLEIKSPSGILFSDEFKRF